MSPTSTPATTAPGLSVDNPDQTAEKKPFHVVADSMIGCLLSEVIAYQNREKAWRAVTSAVIPDRDLKAATGATNRMREQYAVALAAEKAAK